MRIVQCAIVYCLVVGSQDAIAQSPTLEAGPELVRGMPSGVRIAGLARGDTATLEAWRRVIVRSATSTDTVSLRAAGTFVGTGRSIAIDSVAPVAGTWDRADPYALLWSLGRRDTAVTVVPGRLLLFLKWRFNVVDSAVASIRSVPRGIAGRWIPGDGFAGAFAMPTGQGPHPAIILLHGSEGGDSTAARGLAESFAAQGYASFALTYVAFGGKIPGVSPVFVNIPIELLDRARSWMGAQPGVDTSRTGIWGVSKGAEFALVAASRRAWPKAVVACVPSDVVWTGFGREAAAGERISSWSDGGQPLPYIPYDRYDDAFSGRITARAVHDRSRVLFSDSVAKARIDIRASSARFLLLGGDRDEVWASSDMARSLEAIGRPNHVSAKTYEMAGHGICGTGSNMALQYERAYPTTTPPDARATAAAGADAWRRTVDFLARVLR